MTYPDDYDESKETVQEYVNRHLESGMVKEADIWTDSVLHGDNSGGELKGLLNNEDTSYFEYPADPKAEIDVDRMRKWAKANDRGIPITEVRLVDLGKYFKGWDTWFQTLAVAYIETAQLIRQMFPNGIEAALAHRAEVKRVRTQYRRRQMARKRRSR